MQETKEVALLREETSTKLAEVKKLEIGNSEQLKIATDFLGQVKTLAKRNKELKETALKPAEESVKAIKAMFKPIEDLYSEAESIIKNKMLIFQKEERERIAQEEAKIMARVEKGTMKAETAINKLSNVSEVQNSVKSDFGSISTRKIKKFRIINENEIPKEYLTPDLTKIGNAMRANIVIPGVEYYVEENISARGF